MLTDGNWPDLYDPRFMEIWDNEYLLPEDMIDKFYRVKTGRLETERFSQVGGLPDVNQWTGAVDYQDAVQGYDITVTPLEFSQGVQVERKLHENDQFDIIINKPRALAESISRLRQIHRVRPFIQAFSVDTFFYNNTEAVSMCSNSHTTTSGASTGSGFDNLVVTAMSATAVESARLQMVKHRNDQGLEIAINPNMLYYPVDLEETAYEITKSSGKVDQATNNANFNKGRYTTFGDIWLSTRGDTNNWYMIDEALMKRWGLIWIDRIKGEFAQVEDFDTLVGKWRAYLYWANAHLDWRFITGAEVS